MEKLGGGVARMGDPHSVAARPARAASQPRLAAGRLGHWDTASGFLGRQQAQLRECSARSERARCRPSALWLDLRASRTIGRPGSISTCRPGERMGKLDERVELVMAPDYV